MEKKTLQNYSSDEITRTLYSDNIPKNLWKNEKCETEQLFVNHSIGNLKMFQIPPIWIPIVRKLMLELVKVDPDVHFFQVKESIGELKIITRRSHFHEPLIQQILFAGRKAIDTVTLIQLKLMNRSKNDTS